MSQPLTKLKRVYMPSQPYRSDHQLGFSRAELRAAVIIHYCLSQTSLFIVALINYLSNCYNNSLIDEVEVVSRSTRTSRIISCIIY